jgi:hypothetical protein
MLVPTLALADLGDKRDQRRDYPSGWVVEQVYNKQSIAVEVTYCKDDPFNDQELAQILRRNHMPTEVWNYYSEQNSTPLDVVLTWDNARDPEPNVGSTLSYRQSDLGIRRIKVTCACTSLATQ